MKAINSKKITHLICLVITQKRRKRECCHKKYELGSYNNFKLTQYQEWLELGIKVMRKRPQRVGGTQNGKSGFDSSSYTEFYQEHDWHLTFNV